MQIAVGGVTMKLLTFPFREFNNSHSFKKMKQQESDKSLLGKAGRSMQDRNTQEGAERNTGRSTEGSTQGVACIGEHPGQVHTERNTQ